MAKRRLKRQRGRGIRRKSRRGKAKRKPGGIISRIKSGMKNLFNRVRKSNVSKLLVKKALDKAVGYGVRKSSRLNNPFVKNLILPTAKKRITNMLTT